MKRIELPGGIWFEVEDDLLGEVVSPVPVEPVPDPLAEINRALDSPLGTGPLEERLHPDQKVAIIIDDITRQTPTKLMLPPILERIEAAGIPREAVSIVIALGTHRPQTEAENEVKIGREVMNQYRVVNTPADDEAALTYLGESALGVPTWVNNYVAEADIRIGLGSIVPHLDAGFGGGAKVVLPGVCGQKTVETFHDRMATVTTNQLGLIEAPLRLDLEAFVADRVPLDLILNTIPDRDDNIYRCVAGHPVRAHRAGITHAQEVFGAPVERRSPVVLSHGHPHNIDFWQASKGLVSAELMAAERGSLILVADCPEGFGPHPLYAEYVGLELDELLRRIEADEVEDRVAAVEAVALCRQRQHFRIGLVSEGISPEEAATMGYTHYPTIEDAMAGELKDRPEPKVGILTHGGVLAPRIV